MLLDSPIISQGSVIYNAVVESGTAYPALASPGEIFFRSDKNTFEFRHNAAWVSLASSGDLSSHISDTNVHLLPADRAFLSGLTVTAAQVNTIPTLTTNLANVTSSLNTHIADLSVHVTPAQNTFLDGLNLPTLTSANVNTLTGVTTNVQTQFTNQTNATNAVATNLATHIADQTVHVSSTQRIWLNGIDMARITTSVMNSLDVIVAGGSAALRLALTGGTMSGIISMGNNKITGLGAPTLAADAATKKYVDDTVSAFVPDLSGYVKKSGDTMSGILNMGNQKITGVGTPTVNSDATPKSYVDSIDATKLNKAGDAMTGILNMSTNRIINLGTPSLDSDAATKVYVDNSISGISVFVKKAGDTMTGTLTMGANKVTSTSVPSAGIDLTNKTYVDGAVGTKLSTSGGTMTGAIAMGNQKVTGLGAPTADADAATKKYVDDSISSFVPDLSPYVKKAGDTMSGALNMGANKVTSSAAPTTGNDLTNKTYVDNSINSSTRFVRKAGDTMTGALDMGANKAMSSYTPVATNDLTNKAYVDTGDYLNLGPRAGYSRDESQVPLYRDFRFGQTSSQSYPVMGTDNQGRTVLFTASMTPLHYYEVTRGWRRETGAQFVYDQNPVRPSFITADETIATFIGYGADYVYFLCINNATNAVTRTILASTNNSSDPRDWIMYAQFGPSEIYRSSYTLTRINGQLYMLRTECVSGANTSGYQDRIELSVMDQSKNVLRTQVLFNAATDLDPVDRTAQGRTNGIFALTRDTAYTAWGLPATMAYNPSTGQFRYYRSLWFTGLSANDTFIGNAFAMSVAWTIPSSWIAGGTGTNTNLITVKNSTYRYRLYSDSTWDTPTGGVSIGKYEALQYFDGGDLPAPSFDNDGNLLFNIRSIWNPLVNRAVVIPANRIDTWPTASIAVFAQNNISVVDMVAPDSSLWAKSLSASTFNTIGNNAMLYSRRGDTNGGALVDSAISASFNLTQFATSMSANDTYILDPSSGRNEYDAFPQELKDSLTLSVGNAVPSSWWYGGDFTTVMTSATASTVAFVKPGKRIFTVSVSGGRRVYTATSVFVPDIPTSLGYYHIDNRPWAGNPTGIMYNMFLGACTWNGNLTTPVFYAVVSPNAAGTGNSVRLLRCSGGTWTLVSSNFAMSVIDELQAAMGYNLISMMANSGSSLMTSSGTWYLSTRITVPGDERPQVIRLDTSTGAYAVQNKIFYTPSEVQTANPHTFGILDSRGGFSLGFSPNTGYYLACGDNSESSIVLLSRKNPRNSGSAEIAETTWFETANSQYKTWFTTQASTGLVVYLSPYPIFLGGYLTTVPASALTLPASTTSYVFLEKTDNDRTTVNTFTTTTQLSNTFARICIAKITTNAVGIVDVENYKYDGSTLPDQTGRAGSALMTDGLDSYWGPGPIGTGQTWQEPGRAIDTTYTNNTNKPIMVSVTLNNTQTGGAINFYSNGVRVMQFSNTLQGGTAVMSSAQVIVPPGSTYRVDSNNNPLGIVIAAWAELR